MPKANEVKKGDVVELNGAPYQVKLIDVCSPSSRGAATLYKMRFNHLKTGQKHEENFKGDDFIKALDCQKVSVVFSYMDDENYVFMNNEDYSQYIMSPDMLEGQTGYITPELSITGLVIDDEMIGVELPAAVVLEIVDTGPSVKNASATGRTKPAVLSTGLEIQVPEYLENHEKVRVNTQTGKFSSRA